MLLEHREKQGYKPFKPVCLRFISRNEF